MAGSGRRKLVEVRQRHLGAVVGHQHARRGVGYLYRAAIEFALLWLRAIHWHAAIEAAQVQVVGLGSGQNQLLRKRGTVGAPVGTKCVGCAAVDVRHAWAAGWEVYDVLGCHEGDFRPELQQQSVAILHNLRCLMVCGESSKIAPISHRSCVSGLDSGADAGSIPASSTITTSKGVHQHPVNALFLW
jgi:hypothetical protein